RKIRRAKGPKVGGHRGTALAPVAKAPVADERHPDGDGMAQSTAQGWTALQTLRFRNGVMGKKAKKQRRELHQRLVAMHQVIKKLLRPEEHNTGSETYRLLCSLGACVGNWPRIRTRTVEDITGRFDALMLKLATAGRQE